MNVSEIVNQELCISCGACMNLCPTNAIQYTFEKGLFSPSVSSKCIECNLCLKVCPSYKIDLQQTYRETDLVFNPGSQKEKYECYTLYSKNDDIRRNSASGGVITQIIIDLLNLGLYEKAYVLKYDSFNSNRALVQSVNDISDVLNAAKSKYIPASIEQIIIDINKDQFKNSIVVATPCQLLAVKQYLKIKKIQEDSILFLGLFCDKTLNYNIYKYYEYQFGGYSEMNFRSKEDNGWPGNTFLVQNGKKVFIDKSIRMSLKPFFQVNRCRYCFDKLNQLADVSLGDCYIPGEESYDGKSNIIVRTAKGHKTINMCRGSFDLKRIDFSEIWKSQRVGEKMINISRNVYSENPVFVNMPKSLLEKVQPLDDHIEQIEVQQMSLGVKCDTKKSYKKLHRFMKKQTHPNKLSIFLRKIKTVLKFIRLILFPERKINVLIDNAGFENKGAELMLYSVVDQLRQTRKNIRIILPYNSYIQGNDYCKLNDICVLKKEFPSSLGKLKNYANEKMVTKIKTISASKIDVVLDAGGFRYGDQLITYYSKSSCVFFERYYSSFSKRGRKIYFLPQAFGPFNENLSTDIIQIIYKYATVIFAREQTSYFHLKSIFPLDNKIKLYPDFTNIYKPDVPLSNLLKEKEAVILIPNAKMMTHSSSNIANNYMSFLEKISKYILNRGDTLVLLNHEGIGDENIIIELNQLLSGRAIVLTRLNADEVKSVIAKGKLVMSSRYHGVVSALSQGVPTLCTSWSHKYQELLNDYGVPNNILDVENVIYSINTIENVLSSIEGFLTIEERRLFLEKKTKQMWKEIVID